MKKKTQMVNAHTLAEKLDLSVGTIWKYTRENKIPYIKLGKRQYRYKLADVISALDNKSVKEKTAEYKTKDNKKDNKKFTYQDYLNLQEEPGYQYEVLEGKLIKEPSPNVMHQRVSRRLQRTLEDYFREVDPEGEVFDAPLDVTFSDITVVQPDLFYIAGEQKEIIKEKRIDGSPVLAVEIISPYNPRKDRVQKMKIYRKAGIKHYWLVNPGEKTFECFALRNNSYTLIRSGLDEDIIEHPDFSGLKIELNKLWKT